MSFRDDSQLDPSEVRDERGRGGAAAAGSGGRIAVGGGGLGLGGIVVVVLLQVLGGGGGLGQLGDLQDQTASGAPAGDLSRLPDRRRRERPPGLPHRRLRQLGAARSGRTSSRAAGDLQARRRPISRAASGRRAAALRARTSGPSTARPTSTSTSISASSTSCTTASAPPAARSRRATSSRTSTATPCRICSASSTDRQRPRGRDRAASVRTELQADCFAGRVGRPRDARPACWSRSPGAARRRARRRGGRRRRPHPGAEQGEVDPDKWTHGSSAQRQKWFTIGYQSGDMKQLRHVRRLDLAYSRVAGSSSPERPRASGARLRSAVRRGRERARDRAPAEALEELDGVQPLRLRPARAGRGRGLHGRVGAAAGRPRRRRARRGHRAAGPGSAQHERRADRRGVLDTT